MKLQIVKRTGELVPFDKSKIENAIKKAYQDIYNDEYMLNYGEKVGFK